MFVKSNPNPGLKQKRQILHNLKVNLIYTSVPVLFKSLYQIFDLNSAGNFSRSRTLVSGEIKNTRARSELRSTRLPRTTPAPFITTQRPQTDKTALKLTENHSSGKPNQVPIKKMTRTSTELVGKLEAKISASKIPKLPAAIVTPYNYNNNKDLQGKSFVKPVLKRNNSYISSIQNKSSDSNFKEDLLLKPKSLEASTSSTIVTQV